MSEIRWPERTEEFRIDPPRNTFPLDREFVRKTIDAAIERAYIQPGDTPLEERTPRGWPHVAMALQDLRLALLGSKLPEGK